MKLTISKIKRFISKIRGFFPERLPTGMTEFNNWIDSIQSLYTLPTESRTDIVFNVSSIIINLGPTVDAKSKYYFVKMIRAGAAKQVAGACFYEIKTKQMEAAKAAKLAEATAKSEAVANESKQQGV